MAARPGREDGPSVRDLEVRDVAKDELEAGTALLGRALGFPPRARVPAWLALTTTEAGGLALGAFAAGRLLGFSYAVPALDSAGPHLFSCGLAVESAARGHGI